STTTAAEIIRNKQLGSRVPAESVCKQLEREKSSFTVNDYLNGLKKNDLPQIENKGDSTVVLK
nr:hypothetical protein [Eubacterium sp.]